MKISPQMRYYADNQAEVIVLGMNGMDVLNNTVEKYPGPQRLEVKMNQFNNFKIRPDLGI